MRERSDTRCIMKPFYQHLLCIGFLLEVSSGHPSLRPLLYYSCPNETVTYTCHDSQVKIIQWVVEPYVPESDSIIFAASQTVSSEGNAPHSRSVLANLTSLMNKRGNNESGCIADMTTTLTVNTAEVENKTNITCQTQRGIDFLPTSTFLYIASVPYQNNVQITYQLQDTHYTAVVQLADMFDGGGVQIDHYNIQLDNGTFVKSPGPTYSVDVAYNVTVFMNISAYNCAGYSDLVILEISEEKFQENDVSGHTIVSLVVVVTFGVFIIIVITAILVLSLCKLLPKCCSSGGSCCSNVRLKCEPVEMAEVQHMNFPSLDYTYVQVPVVDRQLSSSQQNITSQYSMIVRNDLPTPSQEMIGYAEIRLHASTTQPPPHTEDTVQYSIHNMELQYSALDVALLSATSTTSPPPVSSGETSPQSFEKEEPINETDVHPLDKMINGHLILLQLVPVQPYWRSFGSAAGVDEETLDNINAELSDDREKLAEVIFCWLEQMSSVTWADIASLCKQTGFNELFEAIVKAYESGTLPVQDDEGIPISHTDKAVAPPLPPRTDNSSPPPPPLPPPFTSEALEVITVPGSHTSCPESPPLVPERSHKPPTCQ